MRLDPLLVRAVWYPTGGYWGGKGREFLASGATTMYYSGHTGAAGRLAK